MVTFINFRSEFLNGFEGGFNEINDTWSVEGGQWNFLINWSSCNKKYKQNIFVSIYLYFISFYIFCILVKKHCHSSALACNKIYFRIENRVFSPYYLINKFSIVIKIIILYPLVFFYQNLHFVCDYALRIVQYCKKNSPIVYVFYVFRTPRLFLFTLNIIIWLTKRWIYLWRQNQHIFKLSYIKLD